MSTVAPLSERGSRTLPVLLIVEGDRLVRLTIETRLARRFGREYEILVAGSLEEGRQVLQRVANQARAVALVVADVRLSGSGGIDFLEQVRILFQETHGSLSLVQRESHVLKGNKRSLQRGPTLGFIDFSVMKAGALDEWLYPQIQRALTAWSLGNQPLPEGETVVDEWWGTGV